MRPTAFGIKALVFYATIITAYFVSPYTNLFFLLLSFLSTLLILGCFSALRNLAEVEARMVGLAPFAAERPQEVRLVVSAKKRVRFHINIELILDGKRHPLGKVEVLRGETETIGLLPELPRGIHSTATLRIHSDYPLGLLRCFRSAAIERSLIVHPRSIEHDRAANGGIIDEVMGDIANKCGDMGPSGVREYRPGDPPKLIHWKASARLQKLVVKELEGHAAPGIEVQLDRRCDQESLEHSLSLIAALSFRARDAKQPLALHTQESSQTYGEGHQPFAELLTLLAGMTTLEQDAVSPPPVSPTVLRLPGRQARRAPQGART